MTTRQKDKPEDSKTVEKRSPVKAVIKWLIEVDREYRAAQSIINETHDKI